MGYKSKTQEKNIAWFLPRPRPPFTYKGVMPLWGEEWLLELAGDLLGKSDFDLLNLFCGLCKQGYRVDINSEVKPDLIADAHSFVDQLPNEMMFDVILADPPYSNEEAKKLYGTGKLNYRKWTKECIRVLRPGGILIVYHKLMMPNPDPKLFEVVKRVFLGIRTWHLPRIAIYFKRNGDKDA